MADAIRYEVVLPTSVLTTWQMLTAEEHLRIWVRHSVFLDARLGGRFNEEWSWESATLLMRGRVYKFRRGETIAWTWSTANWPIDTFVTLSFAPRQSGTRLAVSHAGWNSFGEPMRSELRKARDAWWSEHLARLKHYAADLDANE